MYFPREILVLAHVISNFIVMVMGYAVILIIIAVTGYPLEYRYLNHNLKECPGKPCSDP